MTELQKFRADKDRFFAADPHSPLYTHEAHPGENYPHLTSFEQKYRHAQALRDVLGVTRPTCWMRWTGPVIAPTARCPT